MRAEVDRGDGTLQYVPVDAEPSVVAGDDGDEESLVVEARYIEPRYVGIEFDGVVEFDGTLSGYWYDGEWFEPWVIFIFASEDNFIARCSRESTPASSGVAPFVPARYAGRPRAMDAARRGGRCGA